MEAKGDYLSKALELMGMIEPKKIIQEVSGFYPVFEALIDNYKNPITPVVFGIVWRYCLMEDQVCRASLETIGKKIGLDRATVMRHIKILCDDGYLRDLTPDLRNKPHVYVDCKLVIIKSKFEATVAQSHTTVAQNNTGVAQSHTTVAQSHMNKVLNKDINKEVNRSNEILKNATTPSTPTTQYLPAEQFAEKAFMAATGMVSIPGKDKYPAIQAIESLRLKWMTVTEMAVYLKPFYQEWLDRKYSKSNLAWLTDWAIAGEIPRGKVVDAPPVQRDPMQSLYDYIQQKKESEDDPT